MVSICDIVSCNKGYKKCQHKINFISEKFLVFGLLLKNAELNKNWITFELNKN